MDCMPAPTLPAARVADLVGPLAGGRPVYRTLADGLRLLIADGRVPAGTRLPSERDLTGALGVSRTTVTRAYAVLAESGWVSARVGAGTVATLPTGSARRGTGAALFPADVPDDVIDLTCAATRAPAGTAEAYERAVEQLPAYLAGAGYFILGVPELREVIAARYAARGLPTSADQILVTSGAVAGLAVVARALLAPGDRVLIETPTYPNTVDALRHVRARLRPVPVEPTGWDTATVVGAVRAGTPRAAVLIPDFHNPTGALMADDQRAEIGAGLTRAGVVPVIDETIAEVALDVDGPLPLPFAAHAPGTVTVGSSSKSHWGGLRTGWVRADARDLPTLLDARATLDLGAPVLEQLVLLELMRRSPGLGDEHRRDLLAARDAAATAVRQAIPEARFIVPHGGLSLWLELPEPRATEVALAAEAEGLLLAAGPRFAVPNGLDRWVRLPYVLPPDVLLEAVARLRRALDTVATHRSPRPGHPTAARPLVA